MPRAGVVAVRSARVRDGAEVEHDERADALAHIPYTPVFLTALGAVVVRAVTAAAAPPGGGRALDEPGSARSSARASGPTSSARHGATATGRLGLRLPEGGLRAALAGDADDGPPHSRYLRWRRGRAAAR
ncbi:hypothetical protein NKH77_44515 [Streptomyces sp. M19]